MAPPLLALRKSCERPRHISLWTWMMWLALMVQPASAGSCMAGKFAPGGCDVSIRLGAADVSITTDAEYWTGDTAGLLDGSQGSTLHFNQRMGEVTIQSLNDPIGAWARNYRQRRLSAVPVLTYPPPIPPLACRRPRVPHRGHSRHD